MNPPEFEDSTNYEKFVDVERRVKSSPSI